MLNDCRKCPDLVCSRTQIVPPTPAGRLLVIGEAPGAEEDARGEGFVGAAGRTLDKLLGTHGLVRGRDYGVANVVRCRPPGNRKPTSAEIAACLPLLCATIEVHRPRVLLLVGGTATQAFMGRGSLYEHILASREHPNPTLIPMPHTSGLAWNRCAPDGRLWREWGAEQVALAAQLSA